MPLSVDVDWHNVDIKMPAIVNGLGNEVSNEPSKVEGGPSASTNAIINWIFRFPTVVLWILRLSAEDEHWRGRFMEGHCRR